VQVVDRGYAVSEVADQQVNGTFAERELRQGCKMKYAFIEEHRPVFSVRAMCRCLRIHPNLLSIA